jgi:Calx-beta domain
MKTPILRTLALLVATLPLTVQAAAPGNDKFINATILPGRSVTLLNQTTTTATAEVLDPYILGSKLTRSVWYRFDGLSQSSSNHLVLNHTGAIKLALLRLGAVDGGSGALTHIAQTSSSAADVDTLTFNTQAGQRYYLCIEAIGSYSLSLQLPGQANDYFADAQVLVGNQGRIVGSNLNCDDIGDLPPIDPAFAPRKGVWYRWTPSISGQLVVNTNFSYLQGKIEHDTIITIYTGNTLETLVIAGSDDDSGTGLNSRNSFAAVAGTTYSIWVANQNATPPSGSFNLEYFAETSAGQFVIDAEPLYAEKQFSSVRVRRHFAGNLAPSVTLSTVGGSATSNADYSAINTTLNFPGGDLNLESAFVQTVPLTLLPDALLEPTESFSFHLSAATLGATMGANEGTSLLNDGSPVAPGFQQSVIKVSENAGYIDIPFSRGSANGFVQTDLATNESGSDTAKSDSDYSIYTTTVGMLPGQSVSNVRVYLNNDGLSEGSEIITLSLNPTDANLQTDGFSTLTLIIEDDELPLPAPGQLSALLDSDGGIFGSVVMSIASTGAVTGKLVLATGTTAITGKLNASGWLQVRIGSTRTFTVQLLSSTDRTYRLTLDDNERGSTATAKVAATQFKLTNPCPQTGLYTVLDTGDGSISQLMAGSLKVSPTGTATLAGKIFDGRAFVAVSAVDSTGFASVGATLYANRGRLIVTAILPTSPNVVADAALRLLRPGRANQDVELPAINAFTPTQIARYTPPALNTRILSLWNPNGAGTAYLIGGGFGLLTEQSITVSPKNLVTLLGIKAVPTLKLKLVPATGLFTGSVTPPGAKTAKPIYGFLLQGGVNDLSRGFFLNGVNPGWVRLAQ